MANKVFTEENFALLGKAIEELKDLPGALMPVLHEGQKIFGALPLEVQRVVSEKMNVPLAEIYGVVTFYSQFSLEPKGDYHVGVCLGTACYVKGAQPIIDRIESLLNLKVGLTSQNGKFSFEATRCIGACGLAPVMTVNEDVYGRISEKDVPDILVKY